MSWFERKVSQKNFDQFEAQVIRVVDDQRREIEKLKKDISDLHTQLSDFKIRRTVRVNDLEVLNSKPLVDAMHLGSAIKHQEKPREVYQDHYNATMQYRYNSMDLATGMLVASMISDSSSSSYDSSSSSSYDSSSSDSSSSCGGE